MALLAYAVHESSPLVAPLTDAHGYAVPLQLWLSETLATGHPFFLLSWLAGAAHITWQVRTLDLNNRADCWAKFSSNRTLGLIIFAGLLLDYLYQASLKTSARAEQGTHAARAGAQA